MSRTIDTIISVTVNPPGDVVSAADFGTVVIFTPDYPALLTDAYQKYSTLKAFQADFPDADNALLSTAEIFFEQTSRPQYLYVAPWDTDSSGDAVSLEETYAALSAVWDGWYCGIPVGVKLAAEELKEACAWIQASGKIQGITLTNISDEVLDEIKELAETQYYRTLLLADQTLNDPGPSSVISAAALLCSINFSASDSMLTLKFKALPGVTSDTSIDDTISGKLDELGINYYTDFGTKAMMAEGWMLGQVYWADEVIGLDWLKNKIQTDVFNNLSLVKKLSQSDRGVRTLCGWIDKVMQLGKNNGLFADGGYWEGGNVGALSTGDYLEKGYYIYPEPTASLSADDKKNRKCPPITVCAILDGAMHSAQITVNTGR